MKRLFGVALLALPLLAGSLRAEGFPFNVQASCSFCIKGSRGPRCPQAGPWYLYWPLEAHFVAPAPTGYPYWPPPQGLPNISFGGPTCPPGVPVPPVAAIPPVAAAPQAVAIPPVMTTPTPAPQTTPQPLPPPQAAPPAGRQLQLPPYLQPTSYSPFVSGGQPPSYWYDR
jgi:hypothetical protein